jgi:ketosteroid isomerase-like protein
VSGGDNTHVVERLLTAFSNRDAATLESVLAPDFVNHDPPALPGVGTDRAGVVAAMEYLHAAFDGARAELVCAIADGDRVAVHDRLRGTHRGDFQGIAPTGREIDVDFIHLFRVVDGLIVERRGIADVGTLLQQLGATA